MALWLPRSGLLIACHANSRHHRAGHETRTADGAGSEGACEPGVFQAQTAPPRLHSSVFPEPQGKRLEFRPPDRPAPVTSRLRHADGRDRRVKHKIDPGKPLDKEYFRARPEGSSKDSFDARVSRRGAAELSKDHNF